MGRTSDVKNIIDIKLFQPGALTPDHHPFFSDHHTGRILAILLILWLSNN